MNLWWVENSEDLARKGAALFWETAREKLEENSRFSVVLSGGNTPQRMFEVIAERASIDSLRWNDVHFFWADERYVPMHDNDNNYKHAHQLLLSQLNISPKNVHRILTELGTVEECAKAYEAEIRNFFNLTDSNSAPPFDIVFLGVGVDGHTASLFPDAAGPIDYDQDKKLVISTRMPSTQQPRISLTPAAFSNCPHIVFLVSGKEKAKVVTQLLTAKKENRDLLQAQKIYSNTGDILLIADQAALGDLDFSLAG
jgi:6-phosphogluconolactonase